MIKRRNWGDERALARRCRRVFGMPGALTPLYGRGVAVKHATAKVRGEWIIPESSVSGAILYFHGGGYIACSPATHRPITTRLARLTHLPVFAPDYRLAPEHRFPAALDDATNSYRYLIKEHDILPDTIAVAGDSAGGGLVLAVLVRLRDERVPLPACAVCQSPWTDLSGSGASIMENEGRCAMFHPQNIYDFAAAYLGDTSRTNPQASPLFADLSGLPPMLIQVGSTELLLDDARRVHQKVIDSGNSSVLDVYDDVPHGWQMLDPIVPEARAALQNIARFITSHVRISRPDARALQ
jgi:monoterpene epsilon-lactone hydrolase